jgi:polysaccharide pyruvyl transferase WcaK-like protein
MTTAPGVFRVGISGSYGGLNLGDEAILKSIVNQLRASLPVEITVFTRDVKDGDRGHRGSGAPAGARASSAPRAHA